MDICPEYCLAIVPFESLDLDPALKETLTDRAEANGFPLAAMVKDDDRCIRCGLCAMRCPTDAMTMERFSITERWRLQANVQNLFDKTYYLNADGNNNISPGASRGARVALIARF